MNEIKAMPAALNIEEAVVGMFLVDEKSLLEGMMLLKSPEMFSATKFRLIFEAIADLYAANEAVDILTVSNKLRSKKHLEAIEGEYSLIQITQKISSGAHIEHHCRILMQFWLKRKLIQKADKIRSMAFQDDSDSLDLLEMDSKINDELNEILFSGGKGLTYAEAIIEVRSRVEMLSSQEEGKFTGVPTGFPKLDKFTGGWQPSDLVIIAARPGMGKTAFILKNTVECGLADVPVGFFSLEMSTTQLAARTVAINSNFHLTQLIRDGFEKEAYFVTLLNQTAPMQKFPLFIDDTPSQDIRDIIAKARIWKRKHDIKILFLDYIQLVTDKSKGNNREQEISSISRNLKMLAKELNIPVIALSQLSRSVETRVDKRPKLSDLRESGAIEQDADIVTFLYRPEYYQADVDEDMAALGANAEINFAKYRQGSLERKGLWFDANKAKYMDPEERDASQSDEDWIAAEVPKLNPKTDEPF